MRRAPLLITLAFFLRGLFCCIEQPLWEGFDEWAHFAAIQHFANHGRMPHRTDPVAGLVRRSLELAPLSKAGAEAAGLGTPYEAYWKLPAVERERRQQELRSLTTAPPAASPYQYEGQQPPLYYALMALPSLAVRHCGLPVQVLVLRIVSLLLAAAAIPLAYALARRVSATRRKAVLVAAALAAFSGLVINVSRITNDGLAMTLVTLLLLLLVQRRPGWLIGLVLAAALLTKAYCLAFVPLVLLGKWGQRSLTSNFVWLGAAGWWYVATWLATGSFSGEQVEAAAAGSGKLAAVLQVNWLKVADSGAFTHIWTGGWSFLFVRGWMYRVFEAIIAAGLAGLCVLLRRRRSTPLILLSAAYALFCCAMAYHSLVIYPVYRISTAPGWYLCAVAPIGMVLLAAGLGRRALAATVLLLLALDLYAMHFVAIPYYAGLTALPTRAAGAFRLSDLAGLSLWDVCTRLGPDWPALVAALWTLYLLATGWLAACAIQSSLWKRKPSIANSRNT